MSTDGHPPIYDLANKLHQQDLAADSCGCGECDGFRIICPDCGPEAGLIAQFRRAAGVIQFHCIECAAEIGPPVAVAKRVTH